MKDVRGVAVCASCGGAFVSCAAVDTVQRAFDPHAQSMAELAAQHARGAALIDVTDHAACPACTQKMTRFRVGPVEVDTCFTHGSWYDRGELRLVRDSLAAGAATSEVNAASGASPEELAAGAFGTSPASPVSPVSPASPASRFAPPSSTTAPLELARPHKKSPASTPRPVSEIDPGAQEAISRLIKAEHAAARRARRLHRSHGTDHSAIEIVEDILSLFD